MDLLGWGACNQTTWVLLGDLQEILLTPGTHSIIEWFRLV